MIVALHSVLAEGQIAEYEKRHRTIPDALAETFARIGIHNWTIWRSGHDLFHLVDCDDWEAANAALDSDEANAAWQAYIGPCVDHFTEISGPGPAGQVLPQVWSLQQQRAARDVTTFGTLGFGSANAGNLFTPMTDDAAFDLFAAAWDGGIRHFDTAPHYGLGLAEERLGRFLQTQPRNEFWLSTKVGRRIETDPAMPPGDSEGFAVPGGRRRVADFTADGIRRSLEESLARLGLDRVDAIYIHDPEQLGAEHTAGHLATAIPACQALKAEGLVSHIGVGSCSVPALQLAVDHGGIDLLMVAGGFTLLTQPAHPRLLETCRQAGIRILATAPFNSGLLATHPPSQDAHFDYGAVPAEQFAQANQLAQICERYGVELPSAALQFAGRYEPCVATVTGAATAQQARETIARMAEPIPAELWSELRRLGRIP